MSKVRLLQVSLFVVVSGMFASICYAGGRNIFECARNGELRQVKSYVNKDPKIIHATDDKGYTPLHWAAMWGQEDVIHYLLDRGADPMARSETGWTTIQTAESKNKLTAIRILRDHLKKNPPKPKKVTAPDTSLPQLTVEQPSKPKEVTTPNESLLQLTVDQLKSGDVKTNLATAKNNYDQARAKYAKAKIVFELVKADYDKAQAELNLANTLLEYTYEAFTRSEQGLAAPALPDILNASLKLPDSKVAEDDSIKSEIATTKSKIEKAKSTVEETKSKIEKARSTIDKVNDLFRRAGDDSGK